ncbi:MAG: hypothetical protein JWP52_287 [Rhizobacter sp.]|nr:hypothetical protein [Rhizobacter sp.]
MKRVSIFAAALVAAITTLSAQAEVLDAKFFGTVQSETNSGFAIDTPITGEFLFDTGSGKYLSFSIGGESVAASFASTASLTPDMFTALYRAQVSPLDQGGNLNSTFTVDLEALNDRWQSGSAAALLTSADELANNLDTTNSSFGFFTANADGTDIRSLNASLTGLTVTAPVPEPSTWALLAGGLALLGVSRRRRRDC